MKATALCSLIALGACSCSVPPIHIYHVSTGYFLTEKTAAPFLDKKIELYVTDPETEKQKTEE